MEYTTAKDDRVRDSHAKLDGVIRPINDEFWDTYYPPNGWRCRCSVRPSKDEPTPVNKIPPVPVHKHFMHNVGKTGKIFDDKKHPYFEYIKEQIAELEWWKLKDPHYIGMYKNKGKVFASIFADRRDYPANLNFAKAVADRYELEIFIKPDIDKNKIATYLKRVFKGEKLKKTLDSIKNNEYELKIGNEVWQGDLAVPKSNNIVSAIDNVFKNKFGYTKSGTPKQLQVYNKVFVGIQFKQWYSENTIKGMASVLNNNAKKHNTLKAVILKIENNTILLNKSDMSDRENIIKILKSKSASNK